jgi:hypothetical protein
MSERVLRGYDTVPGQRCPYCGDAHMAFVDDGDPDTWKVMCWCGAKARVRKDDEDVRALLMTTKAGRKAVHESSTDNAV